MRVHRRRTEAARSAPGRALGVGLLEVAESAVQGSALSFERWRVALGTLAVSRLRLRLRLRDPLRLGPWRLGTTLRGAFGSVFRRQVCHDPTLDCLQCPLLGSCPYPEVFAPTASRDERAAGSGFADRPRPFVVDADTVERLDLPRGGALEIGLSVFGRPTALVPYFVSTFRRLQATGLGPHRARFDLEGIDVLLPGDDRRPLLDTARACLVLGPSLSIADYLPRADDLGRRDVVLRFTTPVELKATGAVTRRADFGVLMRRLRDRVSALASFYGLTPLDLPFSDIGILADSVNLVGDKTRVIHVDRSSTRTGQRHPVGGFIGEAHYEGEAIGTLMPLLRAGEIVHVGRHAAFGNGKYEVVG